jgi:hypothetical protein
VNEVFGPGEHDDAVAHYHELGYTVLRGIHARDELAALQADMERLQRAVAAGELTDQHDDVVLDDPAAVRDPDRTVNYVYYATRHSPIADGMVHDEHVTTVIRGILGEATWLLDRERFGVVYQDARPGPTSGYNRIGWHTDRQSGPHLEIWPSTAFTIHLDATSPANGFLRVVPGSHRHDTEGIPLGFEKVDGEIALYCEYGDVLLHDADLWHSAARATEDPPGGVRRHLRGGWYTGTPLAAGHGVDDFVKNARR